jgi:hypothetical protein
MAYIKIFFKSDDVQVSASPTTTNAVTFTLRADQNEVGTAIGLYVIADAGYSVDDVDITPTGTTATKWALAPDAAGSAGVFGAYGDPIDLGDGIVNGTKTYFWIKAKAVDTETPINDTSVTLVVDGVASAV